MKYLADNKVDIISIQEPYIHQGRATWIDKNYKIFTVGEGRSRKSVIITNWNVDATQISQHSDEDTITLEVTRGKTAFILGRLYFNRQKSKEQDLAKFDTILQHAKRIRVIIAMDSKVRSKTCSDTNTNNCGKHPENYKIWKQLHIMNEPSTTKPMKAEQTKATSI